MATLKPFAALRAEPELAPKICELPYDVPSTAEALQLASGNPLSFFHVSKPEIDLPPGTDPYSSEVYQKAKENFQGLLALGALRQDPQPCFYLYRQVQGNHSQTGLVAAASCQDYLRGHIKKHELTRPDKEEDRLKHIEILNCQTGPAFLLYQSNPMLDEFIALRTGRSPHVDFHARDGVRHTAWVIVEAPDIQFLQSEFTRIPALYIADGHHRSAAAARVFQQRNGAGHSAWFLSVLFPETQAQILPYNRVLTDLNGYSTAELLEKLDGVFIIHHKGSAQPSRQHELGMYLAGEWRTLNFRPRFAATSDPIEKLDVTLLQKYVLDPVFDIADPRTSPRISFVGGNRGTTALEAAVDSGEFACAFSLFPTNVHDLLRIADAGGIMPPKSTWFEPKLRDGMFCHVI